jgi:hypothetical protein
MQAIGMQGWWITDETTTTTTTSTTTTTESTSTSTTTLSTTTTTLSTSTTTVSTSSSTSTTSNSTVQLLILKNDTIPLANTLYTLPPNKTDNIDAINIDLIQHTATSISQEIDYKPFIFNEVKLKVVDINF